VTLTQTRPNVVNVGGVATLAIDGWLKPPFARASYRVAPPGQGSTSISSLPGGKNEAGGAPLILPETGGHLVALHPGGWIEMPGE
jgi:hypothetical protein